MFFGIMGGTTHNEKTSTSEDVPFLKVLKRKQTIILPYAPHKDLHG
jgi:hypothetical protein